jgi:hypothetical protein
VLWIRIPHHFDPDPDSTHHPDADPGADWDLMRMRIRIKVPKMIRIHADPNPQTLGLRKEQNPVLISFSRVGLFTCKQASV